MRPVILWERLREPQKTEKQAHAAVLTSTDADWVPYRKAVEDVVVFSYVEEREDAYEQNDSK